MAIGGRKPKSPVINELEGNPSNRRKRQSTTSRAVRGIPAAPTWIAEVNDRKKRKLIRNEWIYFSKVLNDLGILMKEDFKELELIVTTSVEVRLLEMDVFENGTYIQTETASGAKVERPRPAAQQLADAKRRLQMLLNSVGLTPEVRFRSSGAYGRAKQEAEALEDPLISGSHRGRRFEVLRGGG